VPSPPPAARSNCAPPDRRRPTRCLPPQTVVDHLLIKTGVVLLARDPFLVDRERNLAVAKETRAHIVVVRIDPKHVSVLARHSCSADGRFYVAIARISGGRECSFPASATSPRARPDGATMA